MILRIWHLFDAPEHCLGSPYLHREVEEWMAQQAKNIPEEKQEAPDLAATDPAGLTTFVAAFGLSGVSVADVHGMGILAGYPGELVFVGLAQKTVYVEMGRADTPQILETVTDPRTGIVTPAKYMNIWQEPKPELRLRGLVVDKTTLQQTLGYVESKVRWKDGDKVELFL